MWQHMHIHDATMQFTVFHRTEMSTGCVPVIIQPIDTYTKISADPFCSSIPQKLGTLATTHKRYRSICSGAQSAGKGLVLVGVTAWMKWNWTTPTAC
jgi:hypothetical protein